MTSVSTMALTEIAGLTGVVVYLLSYGLLQSGQLRPEGGIYPALNVLAASLVLVSLSADFNLASALIQVSWIVISLAGIHRMRLARRQRTPGRTSSTPDLIL